MVKVLLDSNAIKILMNERMVAKHEFRLQKLERLIAVRNIDRTNNSRVL